MLRVRSFLYINLVTQSFYLLHRPHPLCLVYFSLLFFFAEIYKTCPHETHHTAAAPAEEEEVILFLFLVAEVVMLIVGASQVAFQQVRTVLF